MYPESFKTENGSHYHCINGQWNPTHTDSQDSEYEAFELAKSLDEVNAYEAISMGLTQIMGFNHKDTGYNSAKEMYEDLCIDERIHITATGTFISNYRSGSLLTVCQNRDFTQIGAIYNGDGETYGPLLKNNVSDYANTL